MGGVEKLCKMAKMHIESGARLLRVTIKYKKPPFSWGAALLMPGI